MSDEFSTDHSDRNDNCIRKLHFRQTSIRPIAILLLAVHAALLANSARLQSPTFNEPSHLVSGLSDWQFGRFELFRVNPPLVRMVASLPALLGGARTDWTEFHERPGTRPEVSLGRDFVKANGDRTMWLIILARWMCIPFSLLGGFICFRWSYDLFGASAALMAVTLWCFCPNILGHGQLITPDCAATSFGVTTTYLFWRWLDMPNWTRAILTGTVLGITELTKMTWLIMFAVLPVLWLVYQFLDQRNREKQKIYIRAVQLAAMLGIALYILNAGYGFEGSLTRLSEFTFVSDRLKGASASDQETGNRFADSLLGRLPIPTPRNFLLGLDIQLRDFEHYGRPSYLNGHFSEHGWWYYYLYGFSIKIPLGMSFLFVLSLLTMTAPSKRAINRFANEVVLLGPPLCVFIVVSSQSGFSQHFRYILPVFPFLFIATSRLAVYIDDRKRSVTVLVLSLLAWSVGSSLWLYPCNLSYFNELGGGPIGGHAHLIDSNIDWGQDLLRLKKWLDVHPEATPIRLVYYGGFNPTHLSMPFHLPMSPDEAAEDGRTLFYPGWYAVSVNFLRGYPWQAPDESGRWKFIPAKRFAALQTLRPIAMAGYSIYIYRLTEKDANHLNSHAISSASR